MAARSESILVAAPAWLISRICAQAQRLCKLGQYREAEARLKQVWPGVGTRPQTDGLATAQAAEVLLLAGYLTGQLGPGRELKDAQEQAKNLLTESQSLFAALGDSDGAGIALSALGYCSTRAGALDDANIYLQEALKYLSLTNEHARAETIIRLVAVLEKQHQPQMALRLLEQHEALFRRSKDRNLRRLFHCSLGASLTWLLEETGRVEVAARALAELSLAKELCAEVDHKHFIVIAENNSACALIYLHKFETAHRCLDRADQIAAAERRVDWSYSLRETRVRVLRAEGQIAAATQLIAHNIELLEESDQQGLLCESLTTQGEIFVKLRRYEEARTSFLRALETAQFIGSLAAAARAEEQLRKIAKLASLDDARARAFTWLMGSDSMCAAGIHLGHYYKFKATSQWQDGDIVALAAPDGRYIGYIYDAPPDRILVTWADQRYKSKYYFKDAVTIYGVICLG